MPFADRRLRPLLLQALSQLAEQVGRMLRWGHGNGLVCCVAATAGFEVEAATAAADVLGDVDGQLALSVAALAPWLAVRRGQPQHADAAAEAVQVTASQPVCLSVHAFREPLIRPGLVHAQLNFFFWKVLRVFSSSLFQGRRRRERTSQRATQTALMPTMLLKNARGKISEDARKAGPSLRAPALGALPGRQQRKQGIDQERIAPFATPCLGICAGALIGVPCNGPVGPGDGRRRI
jgi:hypothetical protein